MKDIFETTPKLNDTEKKLGKILFLIKELRTKHKLKVNKLNSEHTLKIIEKNIRYIYKNEIFYCKQYKNDNIPKSVLEYVDTQLNNLRTLLNSCKEYDEKVENYNQSLKEYKEELKEKLDIFFTTINVVVRIFLIGLVLWLFGKYFS